MQLEYRKEDPSVPILPDHKMSVAEAKTEVEAEGFKLGPVIETLPRQHILIYTKARCKMKKPLRPIPKFRSATTERKFWGTHDTTQYLDWSQAQPARFPNLRPSTKSISRTGCSPSIPDKGLA